MLRGNNKTIDQFNKKMQISIEGILLNPRSRPILFKRHGIEYRKLLIDHYILIYYVDSNGLVCIYRIFHQAQNYHKYLGIKP